MPKCHEYLRHSLVTKTTKAGHRKGGVFSRLSGLGGTGDPAVILKTTRSPATERLATCKCCLRSRLEARPWQMVKDCRAWLTQHLEGPAPYCNLPCKSAICPVLLPGLPLPVNAADHDVEVEGPPDGCVFAYAPRRQELLRPQSCAALSRSSLGTGQNVVIIL